MSKKCILFFKIGILLSVFCSFLFLLLVLPKIISVSLTNIDQPSLVRWTYYIVAFVVNIPIIIGLYQGYKLLDQVEKNEVFKKDVLYRLLIVFKTGVTVALIHLVAIAIMVFSDNYSYILAVMSYMCVVAAIIISGYTLLLRTVFKQGLAFKEENDLTI